MEKCMICDKQVNFLNKRKIDGGFICDGCAGKMPTVLYKDFQWYSDLKIKSIIDYFNENSNDKYECTASYGDIYIDEMNGKFAIKEKNKVFIFNAIDIKEVGFVCTDVKADQYNKVKCNVEFKCILEHPNIEIKKIIKRNVTCYSKKADSTHISWEIPSDLEMFKVLFNSTIENAYQKYVKQESLKNSMSKHDIDVIKAKALFIIGDDYDLDILKKQRDRLLKVFHPDNTDIEDGRYAKKINYYYNILSEDLEEEK